MAKKGTQHYTDVTRSTGLQSRNRELYYRPTTSSIEWKRERERKKEREKTRGRLDGLLNKKKNAQSKYSYSSELPRITTIWSILSWFNFFRIAILMLQFRFVIFAKRFPS